MGDTNSKSLKVSKISLPLAAVKAMQSENRSALLLLGLFLNEANWLRKLLVTSVLGTSETPDGQANFALTMLLATTLAGKIYEGWERVENGKLSTVLSQLSLPEELKKLRQEITERLLEQEGIDGKKQKPKLFLRIRNNIGFHYSDRKFDFAKLAEHLDDASTTLYFTEGGFGGDVLSHIATLAGLEPLLTLDPSPDYRVALTNVWEELTEVAGMYCRFLSDVMAALVMKEIPSVSIETIEIPDAPNAMDGAIRFYVHPPENLEEMHAEVAARKNH